MSVIFRTDSSLSIGSGHLRRCLTLAENLRGRGAEVAFVSRDLPGNLSALVEQLGFPVLPLRDAGSLDWRRDAEETSALLTGKRPQWLVVDHYGLDQKWEGRMRPHVGRILVVDDLANRAHDCDAILDQNYYRGLETRYDSWVSPECQKLLGTQYVLLRKEFLLARDQQRPRDGGVKRVLVFFGGMDLTNETSKVVEGLRSIQGIALDVVVGATYPHMDQLRESLHGYSDAQLHIQTDRMAELMAAADLYIGSGGSSTWERCFLGLPSLVIAVAENQVRANEDLDSEGYLVFLGLAQDVSAKIYGDRLLEFMGKPEVLMRMSRRGLDLVDGRGVDRVSAVLLG